MNILVTGGAGVLGSSLCKEFTSHGYRVTVLDIVRREEAWRLTECSSNVRYIWKSETDINSEDLSGIDIVLDCAIGFADRPFGNESPLATTISNILPSLNLLEVVRRKENNRPIIIYPSSFNSLYGHKSNVFNETLLPFPSSLYGWTKGAAELLYKTYYNSYGVPSIITRTSSSFGPTGRSDELPHKLILSVLRKRESFPLRSPHAKRLWTYVADVGSFYITLIEKLGSIRDSVVGKTLHLGGNKGERILENIEFADMIRKVSGSDIELVEDSYEEGEIIDGSPISFNQDASWTRSLLNWQPKWDLETALKATIGWFESNQDKYPII